MNLHADKTSELELEPELKAVLQDFSASAKAWSDAAYRQPRQIALPARNFGWRLALSGVLGCTLVAALAGGFYLQRSASSTSARTPVKHSLQAPEKTEAQGAVVDIPPASEVSEQQLLAAARDMATLQRLMVRESLQIQEEEQGTDGASASDDLFAAVDRDLSRQAPRAMDPLVHMMDDSVAQ